MLRQSFQHRGDHVDVDGFFNLHVFIAPDFALSERLFVIGVLGDVLGDVLGREPRGRCLDLELCVEDVGLVEL
ncbi:hypothetical protein [Bradyrhizobium sp. PRIMUS42]|uniref:hypothetical protein n=1 Tax=Bradyrhizobium sp. PRIMUS42 TaxID=2908926 RepID=UPI001FF28271|nr:hypothetical protein [Bradyrhizobium sp. PRIMUS42]MCJ9735450.1 hypothetical protein [Bradyrhizobium sp. PRIMUS42]